MSRIKTRETIKDIRILDKSANLAGRMKDGLIKTKEKAEETREHRHNSPTEYATGNVEDTARGVADSAVHHIPNPVSKARDNRERAGGHFEDMRRQTPEARRQAAEQARHTADIAAENAGQLQKVADGAQEKAQKAQAAVRDAKQDLREVREVGRQTIRDAKIDAARGAEPPRPSGSPLQAAQNTPEPAQKQYSNQPFTTKPKGQPGLPQQPVQQNPNPAQKRFQNKWYKKSIEPARRSREPLSSANHPLKEPGLKTDSPISGVKPDATARGVDYPTASPRQTPDKLQSGIRGKQYRVKQRGSNLTKSGGKLPVQPVKSVSSGATPQKTASIPGGKTAHAAPSSGKAAATQTGGAPVRPTYMNKGVTAARNTEEAAKSLHTSVNTSGKAIKATTNSLKETTKGTVKTAQKSVKTAEQTAQAAVKTAQQSAKVAQKTAQAAAKAAKTAEKAAHAAAKASARAAKAAARATVAMVKAVIAAVKGLASAIAAGGWVAILLIVIICMIGLFAGSIFGIFFSGEPNPGTGQSVNTVIAEIDAEYTAQIDYIIASNSYDSLDMSGARAWWKHVLAVYTVATVSDPDNPMEVAVMTDEKAAILRIVFWDMNTVSHWVQTIEHTEYYSYTDEDGSEWSGSYTWYEYILHIIVTHMTPDEMAEQYGFSSEQKEWLDELLKPEYNNLWNALLYGVGGMGDGTMIGVADTQIGNVGGEIYWRWYGFDSRVEWCAIFVSFVADQCGYIDAGIIPMFASCETGIQWFKDRDQWAEPGYTPASGDLVFFDWEPDGVCDHVGIVESVTSGRVNTLEGNSSDSVARRSYALGSSQIFGYGIPQYN